MADVCPIHLTHPAGGQLRAGAEVAFGNLETPEEWTDLAIEPAGTARAAVPGLGRGALDTWRVQRGGTEVALEVLHPEAMPAALACRLRLANRTPADLRVAWLSPVVVGRGGLRLGEARARDWVLLRAPRQKNDMPACVRLGSDAPGVWDAVRGTPETGGLPHGSEGVSRPTRYVSSEVTGLATDGVAACFGVLPLDRQLVQAVVTLTPERADLESLRVDCLCDGSVVPAGGALESQWVLVAFAGDLEQALETYTRALLGAQPGRPRPDRPPTVWCSWYYYGDGFTQAECDQNLESLERRPLPVDVFQLDECWDRRWGDWRPNEEWPDLKAVAERTRRLGMAAGIWTCPVLVEPRSRLRYAHPDWLLRNRRGGHVVFPMSGIQSLVLDPTVPAAGDFIAGIYRWLRQVMGYTYFKLDFMRAVGDPEAAFHDASKTRAQAFRLALEAVRRGAGPDAYVNLCGGLYGPGLGLADAQRSGSDVKSLWPAAPAGGLPRRAAVPRPAQRRRGPHLRPEPVPGGRAGVLHREPGRDRGRPTAAAAPLCPGPGPGGRAPGSARGTALPGPLRHGGGAAGSRPDALAHGERRELARRAPHLRGAARRPAAGALRDGARRLRGQRLRQRRASPRPLGRDHRDRPGAAPRLRGSEGPARRRRAAAPPAHGRPLQHGRRRGARLGAGRAGGLRHRRLALARAAAARGAAAPGSGLRRRPRRRARAPHRAGGRQPGSPAARVRGARPVRRDLWDPAAPLPDAAALRPLPGVRFSVVQKRAPEVDGYRWLHGVAVHWHGSALFASWGANAGPENTAGEVALGRRSADGGRTWSAVETIGPQLPGEGRSHGVFRSHAGRLWAFHPRFGRGQGARFPGLTMEAFVLDEAAGGWQSQGAAARGIWPLREPVQTASGNWLVPGCDADWRAAVALSRGDDLGHWDVVKIPTGGRLYTEANAWVQGDAVTLVMRNHSPADESDICAAVTESRDGGRTWAPAAESNLPLSTS
ncbi:MAG: alpha-galactosidase, partial [Gemmatimonadota bacterium]